MSRSKPRAHMPTPRPTLRLQVERLEDRLQPGSVLSGWGFAFLGATLPDLDTSLEGSAMDAAQFAHPRPDTEEVSLPVDLSLLTAVATANGKEEGGGTNSAPAPASLPEGIANNPAPPLTTNFLALSGATVRGVGMPVTAPQALRGPVSAPAAPQAGAVSPQPLAARATPVSPTATPVQGPQHGTASATPIPSADLHHVTASVVAHESANVQNPIHPDASINWTTYVTGTTGAGTGRAVAVDSSGNVYTTGFTNDGMTTMAFVAEYSSGGSRIAFTAFQVKDPIIQYTQSEGHGIAVDSSGGVYVVGTATDMSLGTTDAFIMKFDANNQLMPVANYGGGIGGVLDDTGEGVAVDALGEATITGSLQVSASETDLFAVKYTADGSSYTFANYYLSPDLDPNFAGSAGHAIALDRTGTIAYLVGSVLPTGGDNDILVQQIDNTTTGNPGFTYTMPNPGGDDALNGVGVDANGRVYVAGTLDYSGTQFGFVAQLSADGQSLVAQDQLTAMQSVTGLSLDPGTAGHQGSSSVYVVGFGPPGSTVLHAYVEKFDSGLNIRDLAYTSASGSDTGSGIAYDPNSGNAYIAGTTTSNNLSTDGTTLNGSQDAFLTGISSFS